MTATRVGEFIERFPHLARRFFGVLGARGEVTNQTLQLHYLSREERAIFGAMTAADQRHSLELCAKLIGDGHTDSDLLRAALLHDVGKSSGRIPVGYRVAYALAAHLWPSLARWLAGDPQNRLRHPFYVAANHAALGAVLAEQAGGSPRVVALIRGHEEPGPDQLSRLLYNYDRSM